MNKKLLIVDGTSILAEAYYKSLTKEVEALHSLRDSGKAISTEEENLAFSTLLQSKEGVSINAIQGFFKVLFDAMDKTNPTHLAVTWGAQRENNFRRKIFPGYKDDGKVKDRELLNQESLTKELLKGMGIFQLESATAEALDLTGLLITKYKKDFEIEVLARNTLSLQFADEATIWFKTPTHKDIARKFSLDCSNFPNGSIRFDEEFLLKYKKLRPEQLPDYRALIGNSFSKIPGVKSVGEVTVLALLEEYGNIENIYSDIDACSSHDELVDFGNTLTKHLMLPFNPIPFLVKGRKEAFLGKELSTYQRDEATATTLALVESELDLSNLSKVDIIKKLKTICLAPIKCNITKGLIEIIENLDYSSLLVTYNPIVFSESGDMFAGPVKNIGHLDELPTLLTQCDELRSIVNISDSAIVSFGNKLMFDLANSEYYSKDAISHRAEEKEKLQVLSQVIEQVEEQIETQAQPQTEAQEDAHTGVFGPEMKGKTNNSRIFPGKGYELSMTHVIEKDTKAMLEDIKLSDSKDATGALVDFGDFSECEVLERADIETEVKEDIEDVEIEAEEEVEVDLTSLAGYEVVAENYSHTVTNFVPAPYPRNLSSIHNHSTKTTTQPDKTAQTNTPSKKAGLSLLEQMVISRYVCNTCGEEFLLVGSTADYCVKCGAKNINK